MTTTTQTTDLDKERKLLVELGYDEAFIAEYLANRTDQRTTGLIKSVTRKYRCGDCGYRHDDGVEVTLDEAISKPQTIVGYWACDECGSEYWDKIRVLAKEFSA